MKKRLLSAALALAMVLTLIPATIVAPASAATVADNSSEVLPTGIPKSTDKDGTVHYFAEETANGGYTSVTVTYQTANDNPTGREFGKWYWTDNVNKVDGDYRYYYVDSGIVTGTGNSGTWYPSMTELLKGDPGEETLRSTSFTLLGDCSVETALASSKAPTSLTIDVNGFALALPGDLPDKFSSLTITNRKNPLNSSSGSVTAIAKNTESRPYASPAVTYSNLTVNVSNTTVASVNLVGGANSVTLNNVDVTGGVTMNGHSAATNAKGDVTDAYGNQTLNVNNNGVNNLSTDTSFGGAIAISNAASATVRLNNATGNQDVTVNSNGGTVEISGASNLKDVTIGTRAGDVAPATLTINGGSVGAITRVDGLAPASTKGNTVNINSAATAASLEMKNATVNINKGSVTGTVTVKSGALNLTGPVSIGGKTTLCAEGATKLTISGEGSVIGDIEVTANKGGTLTIGGWPTGRKNTFGALNLDVYNARGVKGGTFTSDANMADATKARWFDTNLQYVVDMQNSTYGLYGKSELATAISDIGSTTAGKAAEMHILCQPSTYTLNLVNAGLTWAKIGYAQATGMILPTMVNSYSISTWTSGDNESSVPAGKEGIIPIATDAKGEFTLYANGVATTVVKSITDAKISNSTTVENQNVRVTLNGTNIQLSGAITPAPGSNIATIVLDLTTDALRTTKPTTTAGGGAVSEAKGYITLEGVQVFYNVDTKAVEFSSLQKLDGGAIVNEKGELVLNNGTGTHYTVSASLVQSAPSLDIYPTGKEVQATVGGSLSSLSQTAKDELIAQIAGSGAEFDINGNRAVLEAINAAQATITSDSTVTGWVTAAQNYVWKNGNSYKNATTGQALTVGKGDGSITPHTGNLSTTGNFGSEGSTIQGMYSNAYIVPYLVVNATNRSGTGTFNANLTVYYRVDVSASPYDPDEYYTVKAGTPLSALTGDMATNPVTVKFASAFPYTTATQMHQDGKYVYAQDSTTKKWSINHAGSGNGSLGTIVLNGTVGPITLESNIKNRAPALVAGVTYDDLQAAIDDTVPGIVTSTGSTSSETMDTVTIGGAYAPTECTVNMTGVARKVAVVSNGNRKINKGNNNTEVQTLDGVNFILQLAQDNVPAGTVALTASGTANGTVSLSASTAKAGQTVTVTVLPNAGATPTGVTVKTNTGTTVTATPTGNVNEYSFTVPSGVTSITVTPAFGAASSTAAKTKVTVNTTGADSAVTTAADGVTTPGSTVGVTTIPSAGKRVMSVSVSSDRGNVSAVRQGDNYFTFTVPSNASTVTVTPTFDVDNGTKFTDVWSNAYYSKSVSWAVSKGITDGLSDYVFAPNNTCSRGQMVTFLWRAAGKPSVAGVSNPFVDVKYGDYYYDAVLWAVSKGITDGIDRTHFAPSQSVTRAQAVTFLYRYENKPAASANNAFVDVPATQYYAKAVSWAANKGVTNGKTATTFSPSAGCMRCEIVTFLYRDITGDIA